MPFVGKLHRVPGKNNRQIVGHFNCTAHMIHMVDYQKDLLGLILFRDANLSHYPALIPLPLHCIYLYTLQESFPEYPELLCEAVSLGRRLQEPLLEFTSLACAEDDELLSLRMDPLQEALDEDDLRTCLELELVTRVNDVGVDVNFCLENPHGASMLPFVCGLGPRKAMFLLKVCTILLV